MKVIESISEFERLLLEKEFLLAYFSGPDCSVCHALKPRVEILLTDVFPTILPVDVQVDKMPELAARYTVFTVPAVLLFVDGREYIREVRVIDMMVLEQKIQKIIDLYNE